jgi:ATP-binding cassette, subfamily B, bacterial HlyB/CyaB
MSRSSASTALRCLEAVARRHGIDISADRLIHDYVLDRSEPSVSVLLRIAADLGLKTRAVRLGWMQVLRLDRAFPAIARLANGNFVLLTGAGEVAGTPVVMISDPAATDPAPYPLDRHRFETAFAGERVLLFKRTAESADEETAFGFRWFWPVIAGQGRLLRDVGVAAVLLSILAMAMPVFVQVIIDRVLVHHSVSTLELLVVGMMIATAFEAIFGFVRQYLMLFATNRIDVQVGMRTFAKLISLPMDFFERASTGVITKNMLQTERIRQFLTGQLFSTLLDCIGLLVFIPLMFLYSVPLAAIVLGSALTVSLLMIAMLPPFRRRLQSVYMAEAALQGFLVENIQGMRTIKSLALDARQKQTWDRRLAAAVRQRFGMARFALIAQSLIRPIDNLTQIAVMGLGAYLVFDGSMMVGALIAFRIVASRVTGPLVALSQMIQQFQEVSLSLRMLATIMDHPSEGGRGERGLRVPLQGRVEFARVRFTYPEASSPALADVSFAIPAGRMFGIMGRSGSGKTTVTRLLQGLHAPQEGLIRIDGHDLRELDLDHLRTSIGVVLQDSFLFRGTIRENIAAARPGAALEDIAEAARLAGADEFIERLPRGYDTLLEEGSANLSGGQRQRLAIARALLIDPPILILDEATSALDAESEAILQANLMRIARGRTLIVISHRLASLVACDSIMVLEQGRVEDIGRHAELLGRCDLYRQLWTKQNRHLELVS